MYHLCYLFINRIVSILDVRKHFWEKNITSNFYLKFYCFSLRRNKIFRKVKKLILFKMGLI